MKVRLLSGILFILIGSLTLFLATCDKTVNSGFEDSIGLYSYLEPIEGASNATMVVNKGKDSKDSYFQVEISDIATNHLLKSGAVGAWCLEWKKPMRSNNDEHKGVKWYSSIGNEKWKPMNYFFSIKGELEAADPDLTFREVQAVVWSLAGYMGIAPEFDVARLPDSELPGRLMLEGKPNFSKEKVLAIVTRVKSEYASPTKSKDTEDEGCIVGETDSDQQNVCVPVDPEDTSLATLEGIDSDNDGLRDDVQSYIELSYRTEGQEVINAMRQVAIPFIKTYTTEASDETIVSLYQEMNLGFNCVFSLLEYEKAGNSLMELQAVILNTAERILASDKSDQILAGTSITIPNKNTCK